ncbi:MAG: hypothetical protein JWP25_3112 [Bradyrhizobium sp.]|jgi:hypothetical protein|nr:hypothetical protein [Bradyrhizobium sp.]
MPDQAANTAGSFFSRSFPAFNCDYSVKYLGQVPRHCGEIALSAWSIGGQ